MKRVIKEEIVEKPSFLEACVGYLLGRKQIASNQAITMDLQKRAIPTFEETMGIPKPSPKYMQWHKQRAEADSRGEPFPNWGEYQRQENVSH